MAPDVRWRLGQAIAHRPDPPLQHVAGADDPGARLPRHRHDDVEELYILSGDLSVSGEVVRAGDYCRAYADTVHEESFSETGCLFLLMASQHNEMLA